MKERTTQNEESLSFQKPEPKTNWIYFLSNFINLNIQLKRQPHPMPNINEMLMKLEGFKYVTLIYLNMGYDQILLSENVSNWWMIILPRGK